jgi:hypothetical protein
MGFCGCKSSSIRAAIPHNLSKLLFPPVLPSNIVLLSFCSLSFFPLKISFVSRRDMSFNLITMLQDRAFEGLVNVVALLLSDNQISSLSSNMFQGSTALEVMYVTKSKLSEWKRSKERFLRKLQIIFFQKKRKTVILDARSSNFFFVS